MQQRISTRRARRGDGKILGDGAGYASHQIDRADPRTLRGREGRQTQVVCTPPVRVGPRTFTPARRWTFG